MTPVFVDLKVSREVMEYSLDSMTKEELLRFQGQLRRDFQNRKDSREKTKQKTERQVQDIAVREDYKEEFFQKGFNNLLSLIENAENMKKQGGFIPGIRPGKPTSEYLTKILNYIIFIGAVGLTIVCVIPFVFNGVFGASVSFGGTSLIIIVSVVLETMKQIESQMLVRNYKGFLND